MIISARDLLIAIWIKCDKNWDKTYQAILNKDSINEEEILKDIDTSRYITLLDSDYPKELKQTYRPPFVLER